MKESIKVLKECILLQQQKSKDYQNPYSGIKQADYYLRGHHSIIDVMHAKLTRIISITRAMEHDKKYKPNYEGVEDSAKDLINYASFFVEYSRGKMDGQNKK